MDIALIVVLGALGALLGSFACAQVWRARAQQLHEDKLDGEPVDMAEYARLKPLLRPVLKDRSECLSCRHQLAWYDLIPVVSWLSLGGRCRYCRRSIGFAEILTEVLLSAAIIVSYIAWPHELRAVSDVSLFVVWVIALVLMTILFVYDAKWSLLPFRMNVAFIAVAAVFCTVSAVLYGANWFSVAGAVLLLSGLYLLFSLLGWVGMGDGILGFGLALLVMRWELAFLTLFLANLVGSLTLIPLALRKKIQRHSRIPFGPFLIIGFLASFLWGDAIITWFMQINTASLIPLVL